MLTNFELRLVEIPKQAWSFEKQGSQKENLWQKFSSPVIIKEYGTINSLCFSPQDPYDLAVAASARVQFYNSTTHEVKRSYSRFQRTVTALAIRNNGKLMVAGDEGGLVQLFDIATRGVLRTLKGHNAAVHVAQFLPEGRAILSASDDCTVRVWDVATQTTTHTFTEHTDYIRAAATCASNPHIVATGSYDHTVKLFDLRAGRCVQTTEYDEPVEDILMFPSGSLYAVATGPSVKICDQLAAGQTVCSVDTFQKSVTSMVLDNSNSKLIAGSLDRQVQVFDLQNFDLVHTITHASPVLKIALSPDESRLVAGTTGCTLTIHRRFATARDRANQKLQQETIGEFSLTQANSTPSNQVVMPSTSGDVSKEYAIRRRLTDLRTQTKKSQTYLHQRYERLLRKRHFAEALALLLRREDSQIQLVASVLNEIHIRGGLIQALMGRVEMEITEILHMVNRILNSSHYYLPCLLPIVHTIVDIYGPTLHRESDGDLIEALNETREIVHEMQRNLATMMVTKAKLDSVIRANQVNYSS
ncbi:snoRNA-binding rRNA-processing protein [Dispira parvispora]|uniref:SnoRNA-binding rRNA-processing protein n=1 Tax=Dispira parvispora TaxID=1520584 RepID=A0A9W8APZ1_9FUNG|nr:snoRNA-binding rRNA-processing protein [Dispira parvispora]